MIDIDRNLPCRDDPALVIGISQNSARHLRLAQDLLDAVPDTWTRILASVVVCDDGRRMRTVRAGCGAVEPADDDCIEAVDDAISAMASNAIIPKDLVWVGVWIDFDYDAERLTATIRHGGQRRRPTEAAFVPIQEDDATKSAIVSRVRL